MMQGILIFSLLLSILSAHAEDYNGSSRLWFTLATHPLQASGGAGRATGMERFPKAERDFSDLRTECYGSADENGLGKGYCVTTAADGALWVGAYACDTEVLPPQGVISACSGRSTVLAGTGRFSEISGSSTFTMLTNTVAPDGMKVVFAPGEMQLHW